MSHSAANPDLGDSASDPFFRKPMPQVREGGSSVRGVELAGAASESGVGPMGTEWWRRMFPLEEPGSSPQTATGVLLGHFRIEEEIGRGGMGAVFRAVDTRLQRIVALKVLAPSQASDQSAVDRFQNEAQAAARLDHENIARVYYVGEDQGVFFIAFEFVHGTNVRELIRSRGNLTLAETVNYGLQTAHALLHTDAAGVVHRDIKPSNIIITPTGRAKLVDLGLARKQDPEASKDLTVDGTTLGTFDYISPEQAKTPRAVDVRSDIYSLGCTMYHMLTGEPPYPRGTMLQKLLDHQGKDTPDPAAKNLSVPPELSAVIRRMMAPDPEDRYQTAPELIQDLGVIAHGLGLQPTPAEGLLWTTPAHRGFAGFWDDYRGWILTLAMLLAVVVAIDSSQSLRQSRTDGAGLPPEESGISAVTDTGPGTARDTEAIPSGPAGAETANVESPSLGLSPPLGVEQFGSENIIDYPLGQSTAASAEIPPAATAVPAPQLESTIGPATAAGGTNGPLTGNPELALTEGSDPSSHLMEVIASTVVGADRLAAEFRSTPAAPPTASTLPMDLPGNRPDPFGVVELTGDRLEYYPTLEAACRAAPNNGVVEIRFTGRFPELQRPLRIANKRLTIRAAAGARPVLRFAPRDEQGRTDVARMIALERGALEIYNIDLEVVVEPEFAAERWVLLSLFRAEQLVLRGVSLTLFNAPRYPAAVVELLPPDLQEFSELMSEPIRRPATRVDFANSLVRGEADLFRIDNADAARIRMDNVAIALSGSVMSVRGVDTIDLPVDYIADESVEMSLQHVTVALSRPLVDFEVRPDYAVPAVLLDTRDSIIVISEAPLVAMRGDDDVFQFQSLLNWSGSHNVLQIDDPVWRIESELSFSGPRDFTFEQWQEVWRRSSRAERRARAPLLQEPSSRFRAGWSVDDFALRESDLLVNPAAGSASDGRDVGVQLSLERIPAGPAVSEDFSTTLPPN